MPSTSRLIFLSNPSKLHLAASLYRRIDKPNFKYVDASGIERRSDFPYFYQVYLPPNGIGPVGCTRIFVPGGEAAQTFVLQATDYFFQSPTDTSRDGKPYVGFIEDDARGRWRVINLHATKPIHVTIGGGAASTTFELSPQAVSAAEIGGGLDGKLQDEPPPHPVVTGAQF